MCSRTYPGLVGVYTPGLDGRYIGESGGVLLLGVATLSESEEPNSRCSRSSSESVPVRSITSLSFSLSDGGLRLALIGLDPPSESIVGGGVLAAS